MGPVVMRVNQPAQRADDEFEPDERTRQVASARIGQSAALAGTAEALPVPDASFDAVVGGQMWHWVDRGRAIPEVARVLHPGGCLSILWILRDDRVGWISRLGQVVTLPDYFTRFDDDAVPAHGQPFGPHRRDEQWFAQLMSPVDVLGHLRTLSSVAHAADANEQLAAAAQLIATDPDVVGRETVQMPYVCKAFTSRQR